MFGSPDLTEEGGVLKKTKNIINSCKMGKEIITFRDIEKLSFTKTKALFQLMMEILILIK